MNTIEGLQINDHYYNYRGGLESEQIDALRDADGVVRVSGLSDNGGEPNGNAWLIWSIDATDEQIAEAVRRGAEKVTLYQVDYNAKAWRKVVEKSHCAAAGQGDWSGLSIDQVAVFTDPADAELCQQVFDER